MVDKQENDMTAVVKKIKLEMEVWCDDSREFHNLMHLIKQARVMEGENGRHCGYGFAIKVDEVSEKEVRKALDFRKSDVNCNCDD
jgi:DNA-binding winged helix-turn-helix (wHTH) protein